MALSLNKPKLDNLDSGIWKSAERLRAGGTREMKTTTDTSLAITADYRQFIEELKARVATARISAARKINHELILLYWDIGRGIVEKQAMLGWGSR